MEYKQEKCHRHDESHNNKKKMRPIFLDMDDFFLGISLFKYQKPEILSSSSELIPEIFEHCHIVSSYILGTILTIELCIHPSHLCLDAKGIRDHNSVRISENEAIDIIRETPREHEKKISRKQKARIRKIDREKSRIFSIYSGNRLEGNHLRHITRDEKGVFIHIDRVHSEEYEPMDPCVQGGAHSPSQRVLRSYTDHVRVLERLSHRDVS